MQLLRTFGCALSCRVVVGLLLVGSLGISGCSQQESLEAKLDRSATLPKAIASANLELSQLVAQIDQEGTTPAKLHQEISDDSANAAVALAATFNARTRGELLEKIPWLADPSQVVDSFQLVEAAAILKRYEPLTKKLRAAGNLPRCAYQPNHRYGFFASQDYLNDTARACRIAIIEAYDIAMFGEAEQAFAPLERAFRWAGWLGRVEKVEARVLAATLRADAFRTAQLIMGEGRFGPRDAEKLYGLLRDQLAVWPTAQRMLVGDRSATLLAYELIGEGPAMVKRHFTSNELDGLERQGLLEMALNPSDEVREQDELNYLQAMNSLIEASQQGAYYQWAEALPASRQTASNSPGLYANRFFLSDIEEAIDATTRDRARCEAWCLAISLSAQLKQPPFTVSPMDGKPYAVEVTPAAVKVRLAASDDYQEQAVCPNWQSLP